jgi:hypothetical protein
VRYVGLVGLALVLLGISGAAQGAAGDPFVKSCVSQIGGSPCASLAPAFKATDVEPSPDARQLYAVVIANGGGFNGIRIFDVGPTGTIGIRSGGDVSTDANEGLDADVTADGRNLYLAAGAELRVYSRDLTTGALTLLQTVPGAAETYTGLALSPDGTSLYARGTNRLTVFDRDVSGSLAQKSAGDGCFTEAPEPPCTDGYGLGGFSTDSAVTSDGRHLYVSSSSPGGVTAFQRASDGKLVEIGCFAAGNPDCAAGPATLAGARAANVDPLAGFVIASGDSGNSVFRRDVSTGGLTLTDCLDEIGGAAAPAGCHEIRGATGSDAAISPDGRKVTLNASFGLSFLTLDRTTGMLAQPAAHGCVTIASPAAPCDAAPGLMGGLGTVVAAADNLHLFAAFRGGPGGSVASIERDIAPACQSKTITVRTRKPLVIPLVCTDANGDKATLEIASPPTWGDLSSINQSKSRVTYEPAPVRKGKDTFKYRGTARGTKGTLAAITLNVVAKPLVTDRKAPNTKITASPKPSSLLRGATFKFASTEKRSTFQCKLDRTSWQRCRSPMRYRRVKVGKHTFQVRAMDRAGNVDRTPAKRIWKRIR